MDGHCADTKKVRAPVIVQETADTLTIANFRHARSWWIASIPKNGIAEVYLQNPTFILHPGVTSLVALKDVIGTIVSAGHVSLRMVMSPASPIQLRSQIEGDPSTAVTYSVEISPEPFGDQQTENYTRIVPEFFSEEERAADALGYKWYSADNQTELRMTLDQRKQFLKTAVQYAIGAGYNQFFGIFSDKNCISMSVDILAQAFPSPRGSAPSGKVRITNFYDPLIGNTRRALHKLKLIDDDSAVFDLNSEFSSGVPFLYQMLQDTRDEIEKKQIAERIKQEPNVF